MGRDVHGDAFNGILTLATYAAFEMKNFSLSGRYRYIILRICHLTMLLGFEDMDQNQRKHHGKRINCRRETMHQKTTVIPEGFLWGLHHPHFRLRWMESGRKGMTVADFNSFKRSHIQADTKVASDFYHHWKEDIDYMAELGLKCTGSPLRGPESYRMAMNVLRRD